MKAKLYILLLGLVVGIVIGLPAGMNLERDAPLLSNPFAERDQRAKVMERIGEQTDRAVSATKEGARKALDATKEKLHESTKPDSNN